MELDFEYLASEVNPQFANIVSPTEVVVVSSFRIDLEGGGGDLHVTMPYSMIEPIKDQLDAGVQSDRTEIDERWTLSLREEMKEARVNLNSNLIETELTLRDVVNMKAGDVIPIELNEQISLCVEDIPAFKARFGISKGVCAVKIDERIKSNLPMQLQMGSKK